MSYVLSQRTKDALHALIRARDGGAPAGAGYGSAAPLLVRCTSATAVGGSDILDQCYPAVVLAPAADYEAPPEELYECLLTVLTDEGDAGVPIADAVYLAVPTADVDADASGSGSTAVAGRLRFFAPASGTGNVTTGGGTDYYLPMWQVGTGVNLVDSPVRATVTGLILYCPPNVTAGSTSVTSSSSLSAVTSVSSVTATATYLGASSGSASFGCAVDVSPGTTRTYSFGTQGTNLTLSIPNGQVFYLKGSPSSTPNAAYGIYEAGSAYDGVTGTLAPGMLVKGGIIVSAGSGTIGDVLTSANNTLTGANTFVAPNAASTPVTVRGAASQSANLLVIENSAGTDLMTVSASGVISGDGSGLTDLNASELTTGTVPFAATSPDLLSLMAAYGG